MTRRVVTLLTDFGIRDPYVGVMKAALHRLAPEVSAIDLTHDIPPQNIGVASFWLSKSQPYFEPRTVHLVVVDPGVGTERRPVAFEWADHFFVGPDNGIFTDLLTARPDVPPPVAVELDRTRIPSQRRGTTFDGRDLFAPAAALIATGQLLSTIGRPVPPRSLRISEQIYSCSRPKVRAIDHYGNLLTDAPIPVRRGAVVSILGRTLPWCATYAEAPPREAVAIRGSWGTIEVAVNQGSAAELLGATIGTPIRVD